MLTVNPVGAATREWEWRSLSMPVIPSFSLWEKKQTNKKTNLGEGCDNVWGIWSQFILASSGSSLKDYGSFCISSAAESPHLAWDFTPEPFLAQICWRESALHSAPLRNHNIFPTPVGSWKTHFSSISLGSILPRQGQGATSSSSLLIKLMDMERWEFALELFS